MLKSQNELFGISDSLTMRIVMMGTGTFAEPTFAALIAAGEEVVGLVTQPDREAGVKRGSTRQTGLGMANIAKDAAIPVAQPESINTPEGIAILHEFRPDLLVVAAYGQILSKEVIAVPPMGAINVHASLLPKYRGASPIAHAILQGEKQTGVTIIRITVGLDAGDMLARESLDILPDETTGELEARLAPIGARMCLDIVTKMKLGPISGVKQDQSLVTKAPKMKKESGAIDWTKPAESIHNHIRAMQPWPTAYTYFHRSGKEPMRLIICSVKVIANAADRMEVPGTLRQIQSRLEVSCGSGGVMEILELQPAGKKRMTAAEFLRGYPIDNGFRFGPEKDS